MYCGHQSRAATIYGAAFNQVNTVCLHPYTKKLFMRISCVPAIESCMCLYFLCRTCKEAHNYGDSPSSQFLPLSSQIRDTTRVTSK